MRQDEDSLICDFLETYRISDYRAVPPSMAARLFFGLSDGSRIKRSLSGEKLTLTETLLAIIADRLGFLAWAQTKDGQKNRNRPTSILEALRGQKQDKNDVVSFASAEDFETAFQKIATGGG